jgi:hypothetical protein
MLVMILEAHFMRVFVPVTFVAVDMFMRDVFVLVTGVGVCMGCVCVLVIVVVWRIVPMFFTHTFISISFSRGVAPAVAT